MEKKEKKAKGQINAKAIKPSITHKPPSPLSEEGRRRKPLTPKQQEELDKQFRDAAKKGKTEDIRRLAKLGADINSKDNDGRTAIHFAAYFSTTETCRVLKELGADINSRTNDDLTALHVAAGNGYTETCRFLVKELGADVNAKGDMGWTVLHLAAGNGHTETCRVLCWELSANPLIKDKGGKTARDLTNIPEIKKLLKTGENVWKSVGEKKIKELFGAIKECNPEKIGEIIGGL